MNKTQHILHLLHRDEIFRPFPYFPQHIHFFSTWKLSYRISSIIKWSGQTKHISMRLQHSFHYSCLQNGQIGKFLTWVLIREKCSKWYLVFMFRDPIIFDVQVYASSLWCTGLGAQSLALTGLSGLRTQSLAWTGLRIQSLAWTGLRTQSLVNRYNDPLRVISILKCFGNLQIHHKVNHNYRM